MARPGMKQVNVALPDTTRTYLEEIAAKNGRKLSEEVRARLDQSVVDDRFDAATQELGRDVMWLARLASRNSNAPAAEWKRDRVLFDAFRRAVDDWLGLLSTEFEFQHLSEATDLDAVTLGRSITNAYADMKPMLIKHRPGGDNMEE
ncbi:hypothetical protein ABIB07_003953 [Bradyrhizobium sp. RT10b]